MEVTQIDIGQWCMKTYPCKHDCKIYYKNGEVESRRINGREIIKHWDVLTYKQKQHFEYLKKDYSCFSRVVDRVKDCLRFFFSN